MTLTQANKAIKDATIAGIITIIVTLMLTLIYASGAGLAHIDLWNIIDLVVLSGLTYGIYRKSRLCAILMPVYYLSVKTVLWVNEGAFIGVPLALIFTYFFWRGVQGTWAYHKLMQKSTAVILQSR